MKSHWLCDACLKVVGLSLVCEEFINYYPHIGDDVGTFSELILWMSLYNP